MIDFKLFVTFSLKLEYQPEFDLIRHYIYTRQTMGCVLKISIYFMCIWQLSNWYPNMIPNVRTIVCVDLELEPAHRVEE